MAEEYNEADYRDAQDNELADKLSEPQKFDLFKQLESYRCLWETSSADYKKKELKARAVDELSQKFNISPQSLKKQLHSLRTALTREIKKENADGQSKWKFFATVSYMKDDVVRSLKAKEETEWTEEETEQLMEYYKQNDQLWNHHLSSYKDRSLRELNFKKLGEILPNRSPEEIKKQWNTLKTIFYREVKKEEESKVSGAGTDTSYASPWRFYKGMMFVKGSDDVDPAVTTLAAADAKENEKPAKKTKLREIDEMKLDFFKEAVKCLQSPVPTSYNQGNPQLDSISLFVKSLESTLRKFSDRHLAIAKKRINDIIFELEMECFSPQTLARPSTAASFSLPTSDIPQAPASTLSTDNFNWPFQ